MKILICSDGSEQADRAIRLGAAIATGAGAQATLFGIIEVAAKSNLILDSLQRWQAVFADKKIPIELITKPGDPVVEIVKRTEADNYDLVIIGAVRIRPPWVVTKPRVSSMSRTASQITGPASGAGGRPSTHWPMRPGEVKSG